MLFVNIDVSVLEKKLFGGCAKRTSFFLFPEDVHYQVVPVDSKFLSLKNIWSALCIILVFILLYSFWFWFWFFNIWVHHSIFFPQLSSILCLLSTVLLLPPNDQPQISMSLTKTVPYTYFHTVCVVRSFSLAWLCKRLFCLIECTYLAQGFRNSELWVR